MFSGAYADEDTGCRVYRYCRRSEEKPYISFMCPTGTLYNQHTRNCDWWFKVKCQINNQNENIVKNTVRRDISNEIKNKFDTPDLISNASSIRETDSPGANDIFSLDKFTSDPASVLEISTETIAEITSRIAEVTTATNMETPTVQSSVTQGNSAQFLQPSKPNPTQLNNIQQSLISDIYFKQSGPPQTNFRQKDPDPHIYGSLGRNFTSNAAESPISNIQPKTTNRFSLPARTNDDIDIILAHNGKKQSLDELTRQFQNSYGTNSRGPKPNLHDLSSAARKHEENLALVGLTRIPGISPHLSLFDKPVNPNLEPVIRHTETFPALEPKYQQLLEKVLPIPVEDAYRLGLLKHVSLATMSSKDTVVVTPEAPDLRGGNSDFSSKQNGGSKSQGAGGSSNGDVGSKKIYYVDDLYSINVFNPVVQHIVKNQEGNIMRVQNK